MKKKKKAYCQMKKVWSFTKRYTVFRNSKDGFQTRKPIYMEDLKEWKTKKAINM